MPFHCAQRLPDAALDMVLASVCARTGVGYVRVIDQLLADPVWMTEVSEDDGAHPGGDGYQRLADLVWPYWNPWIRHAVHGDPHQSHT